MAIALTNAARLKPEIQLSLALQEFESVLDQDQRARLNVYKEESPPGACAPLAFASLLDRCLEIQHGQRRLGPKAMNLLQGTQQFAAVIDFFVGGSQNLIASSVWGILKLSLLVGKRCAECCCMASLTSLQDWCQLLSALR